MLKPKGVLSLKFRYGQVVKIRDKRKKVIEISRHSVYGHITLETISIVYIERHTLNLCYENRRLTGKTIGFSKKVDGLKAQMAVYQLYGNSLKKLAEDNPCIFNRINKPYLEFKRAYD